MKFRRLILTVVLCELVWIVPTFARQSSSPVPNAALRYWSAIAEMRDVAVSEQQARDLNAVADGTVPYDDTKYKELVEANEGALETMARGTTIGNCDWGIDYELGSQTPVEYARRSLALGRLNVLYAYHLLAVGDRDHAVRVLAAGLQFAHDVSDGGTLFATVAAKSLLTAHLEAVTFAVHSGALSAAQRSAISNVLARLGADGLDWRANVQRELAIPRVGLSPQASSSLAQIASLYLSVLDNPPTLPNLQQMISQAPQPLPNIIPNPKRVLDAKQDLTEKLRQTHSLLQ